MSIILYCRANFLQHFIVGIIFVAIQLPLLGMLLFLHSPSQYYKWFRKPEDVQNEIARCQEILRQIRNKDSVSLVKPLLSRFIPGYPMKLDFSPESRRNDIDTGYGFFPAQPPHQSVDIFVLSLKSGTNECIIRSARLPDVARVINLDNESEPLTLIIELLEKKIQFQNYLLDEVSANSN